MSGSYRDISRWATIRIVDRRINIVSLYRHIVSSLLKNTHRYLKFRVSLFLRFFKLQIHKPDFLLWHVSIRAAIFILFLIVFIQSVVPEGFPFSGWILYNICAIFLAFGSRHLLPLPVLLTWAQSAHGELLWPAFVRRRPSCVVRKPFYLRYDLPNGFTYLQLGRDFINLFFIKYMPF